MNTSVRNKVLLRGEQSDTAVSIVESTMPAGAPGPPLHSHAFDEAFYVLDGALTFQLGNRMIAAKAGELVFARRGLPHTLANTGDTPARYLLVITPAGFEREFARRAAKEAGAKPPKLGVATDPRSQLPRPQDRRVALRPRQLARRSPRATSACERCSSIPRFSGRLSSVARCSSPSEGRSG